MEKINQDELVDFALEDGVFKTLLTKKFKERRPYQAPNTKEICSIIPGTIISIAAQVGEPMKKGDLILIHEAMKMMNRVEMPYDGTLASINVEAGENIAKNVILAVIA